MHKQVERLAVPNRLTALMRERGIRDVKLAAHCDVDQSTVYRWRMRFSPIDDRQKESIADFLGVSRAELMGWENDREKVA